MAMLRSQGIGEYFFKIKNSVCGQWIRLHAVVKKSAVFIKEWDSEIIIKIGWSGHKAELRSKNSQKTFGTVISIRWCRAATI